MNGTRYRHDLTRKRVTETTGIGLMIASHGAEFNPYNSDFVCGRSVDRRYRYVVQTQIDTQLRAVMNQMI
jgi:hypothetical protein